MEGLTQVVTPEESPGSPQRQKREQNGRHLEHDRTCVSFGGGKVIQSKRRRRKEGAAWMRDGGWLFISMCAQRHQVIHHRLPPFACKQGKINYNGVFCVFYKAWPGPGSLSRIPGVIRPPPLRGVAKPELLRLLQPSRIEWPPAARRTRRPPWRRVQHRLQSPPPSRQEAAAACGLIAATLGQPRSRS